MRLIDADVLDQGSGNIPPLEVRLDLQPGDRVGLYQEVQHPSMGAGYSPIEAVVLGSPEPGWFIGETEDGQEITFHAGNVADVQMGSPQMGGIFDWFKRMAPPTPGAMVPVEQPAPSQLPALPAKPEERRGMIAQLKTFFASPFTAVPQALTPAAEKKSLFDIFKKGETPQQKAGLPVERGESGITTYQKKGGMFSFLDPEAPKPLARIFERAASIIVPEKPGPLAPIIEKALEPFVVFPQAPEPEPFEVRKAKQMELWSGMFAKEPEKPQPPLSKMFEMFPKEEIQSYEEVVAEQKGRKTHRKLKVLPMPRRNTLLPSLEELARGLAGYYHPIEALWQSIRDQRNTDAWREQMETYGFAKDIYESIGNCGGPPHLYQELSAYLHIPWEEFRNRAEIEFVGTDEERWINNDIVELEIVVPSVELITQALDLMKPEDIPGHFIMEKDAHGCLLKLMYTEGEEKPDAEERFAREQQQQYQQVAEAISESAAEPEQEEEEKSIEEIAEALDNAIQEEEQRILKLTEELQKLAPDSEEIQEISETLKDDIAESKATLHALTEELSNLPVTPKQAPAKRGSEKKKPAKRGGKKKRK